jgi:hypothetical protein
MAARYQKLYRMRQPDAKQLWDKLASDHQDKVLKDLHGLRTKLLAVTLEDSGKVENYAYIIQSIIDKYNSCASEESQLCKSCRGGSTSTNFVNLTLDDDDDDDDANIWPISRHEHVFTLLHGLPDTPDWHLCIKLIKQQPPSILGRPAKVIESLQDMENELLEWKGLSPDALLFMKGEGSNRNFPSNGKLAPPAMPMGKVNPVSPALIVTVTAMRSLDATISRKAFLPSARTVTQALEEMVKATTQGEERRAVRAMPMI